MITYIYKVNFFGKGKKDSILFSFWRWRRFVSSAVLIAFLGSMFSTVFASHKSIKENEIFSDEADAGRRGNKINNNLNNYHMKQSSKESNNSSYFVQKSNISRDKPFFSKKKYQPYLELGVVKQFNQNLNVAGIYDLFIPLFQAEDRLFFADLRIFDQFGGSFEGNVHLGFRKLYPDKKQMFGIYASFDRKRMDKRNWFSQLMVGAEYWNDKWFVGGNIYKPVGKSQRLVKKSLNLKSNYITEHYDKALPGFDMELGYSFTSSLTGYAGGYYFHEKGANIIAGPKLHLAYNYDHHRGRILGVLDGIGVEVGAKYDKPRGTTAYIGVKFKIGLTNLDKNSNLFGFERHMTGLVRRDPDIVVGNAKNKEYHNPGANGFHSSGGGSNRSEESNDYSKKDLEGLLEEFGLSKDSLKDLSEEEALRVIKKKYNEYVFRYHPDVNGAKEGTILYKQHNNAFIKYTKIRKALNDRVTKNIDFDRGFSSEFSRNKISYSHRSNGEATDAHHLEVVLCQQTTIPHVVEPRYSQIKSERQSSARLQKILPHTPKPMLGLLQRQKVFRKKNKETEERQLVFIRDALKSEKKLSLLGALSSLPKHISNLEKQFHESKKSYFSNATDFYSTKPVIQLGAGLGSKIAWLGSKLNELIKLTSMHPKTFLSGIVVALPVGWISTKYFLNYLFGSRAKIKMGKGRRRWKRGGLYLGGGDGGDNDDEFPPDDNWRDLFPLFLTIISGSTIVPVFIPRDNVNERFINLALESFKEVSEKKSEETSFSNHKQSVLSMEKRLSDKLKGWYPDLGKLLPMLTFSDWNYRLKKEKDSKKLKRKSESEKRVKKRKQQRVTEDTCIREEALGSTEEIIVNLDYEYEDNDMDALLELRVQEERLGVITGGTIVVLPSLDYLGVQLRDQLIEERRLYREERRHFARTILIPLHVLHLFLDHWTGLAIHLDRSGRVIYVEFVDSLGEEIPDNVETTLRDVYGEDVVIRNVQGLQQTDGTGCGPLTVENLIQVAQNRLRHHVVGEREMRVIRAHHIELAEWGAPELQFNFRQIRNIRSFRDEKIDSLRLTGGVFADYPNFSPLRNIKLAIFGGAQADGEKTPLLGVKQSKAPPPVIGYCKVLGKLLYHGGFGGFSFIVFAVNNFLGAFMLSLLGDEELASSAFITTLQNFFVVSFIKGLLTGAAIIQRSYDTKKYLDIGLTLQQSWIISLIFSACSIPLAVFSKEILIHIFKQSSVISTIVQRFFRAYAWGIPAAFFLVSNNQIFKGIGRPELSSLTTLLQKGITISLATIFLFLLKSGPAGLGYANAIGNWAAFFGSLVCLLTIDYTSKYKYGFFNFCRNIKKCLTRFGKLLMVGLPKAARYGIQFLSWQILISMAGLLGQDVLRGVEIAEQYMILLMIPSFAMGGAAGKLAGGYIEAGAKRNRSAVAKSLFKSAIRFGNVGLLISWIFPAISIIMFAVIPRLLVSLFTIGSSKPSDDAVVSTARTILLITGGGILSTTRETLSGALEGFLDTSFPAVMSFLGLFAISWPLAHVFVYSTNLGVKGIFIAKNIGWIFCIALLSARWIMRCRLATTTGYVDDRGFLEKLKGNFSQMCRFCGEFFRCFCCFRERDISEPLDTREEGMVAIDHDEEAGDLESEETSITTEGRSLCSKVCRYFSRCILCLCCFCEYIDND